MSTEDERRPISSFAKDHSAIQAAITNLWSNGRVNGPAKANKHVVHDI